MSGPAGVARTTRTTPPRPLDVEALFPELSAWRGTTTRLHPRPGAPDRSESSVGGPMLWPADEPWPSCDEAHAGPSGTDPLPMIGLAQLFRRDVPDLPAGPDDCDLLQVFWCPFRAHGPSRYGLGLDLRWRRSREVRDVLTEPPQPPVVGADTFVPEPCVLHPEQVTTYPFAGLLPEELCARIDAWEDAQEARAERPADAARPVLYQYDLSIPPGWRVGGFASWHLTDPYPMDCLICATPMRLLMTVDSSEWDGGSGSWRPLEDQGKPPYPYAAPTRVTVGRCGELNLFACPGRPEHPHRWSIQ